jgi:hypothetical protein
VDEVRVLDRRRCIAIGASRPRQSLPVDVQIIGATTSACSPRTP